MAWGAGGLGDKLEDCKGMMAHKKAAVVCASGTNDCQYYSLDTTSYNGVEAHLCTHPYGPLRNPEHSYESDFSDVDEKLFDIDDKDFFDFEKFFKSSPPDKYDFDKNNGGKKDDSK